MRRSAVRQNPYLLSYSDLMAALLLVFILILVSTLLSLKTEVETNRDQAKRITVVKYTIIEKLKEAFRNHGVNIEVDASTGAIKLPSDILFDTGSSELRPGGKEQLGKLFPIYLSVLLDPEFETDVKQIIIEGHTDPAPPKLGGRLRYEDAYLYNLQLSQDRARSVASFILGLDFDSIREERHLGNLAGAADVLKNLLTANGRSFSRPLDAYGHEITDVPYYKIESGRVGDDEVSRISYDLSRRVEFKFRLNDEEYLMQIYKLLEGQIKVRQ